MIENSDLHQQLQNIQNLPVLVVGDVVLDRYVHGSVNRISSEGPIPVQVIGRQTHTLGSAGNLVANLCGLGAKAFLVGVCGQDEAAGTLRETLNGKVENPTGLIEDSSRSTTVKSRFLVRHQQIFRSDIEQRHAVSEDIERQLCNQIDEAIPHVKIVVLSDYALGVLTPKICQYTIQKAKSYNIPVIVDPRGQDFTKYNGVSIITPNRAELSLAVSGMDVGTDENVEIACGHIMRTHDIGAIVATRSEQGMSILDRDAERPVHMRTQAVEVFDVSGAGDTVVAGIACSYAAGTDLISAARFANICAGIVVQKIGTSPILKADLISRMSDDDEERLSYDESHDCIHSDWAAAMQVIEQWRTRDKTIGFTNGCFDVLHAGHVAYLQEAARHCDKLVIGLNADQSVRRLKGDARPVNIQSDRASVLRALRMVDMVVYFGENPSENDSAIEILKYLKPDIYFKGSDYTLATLPEAATVQSYNGCIHFCDLKPGKSSTNTIAALKNGTES